MKMLVAKEVLENMKSVDMSLCERCDMGKHIRVNFIKAAREPKKAWLEMMFGDLL